VKAFHFEVLIFDSGIASSCLLAMTVMFIEFRVIARSEATKQSLNPQVQIIERSDEAILQSQEQIIERSDEAILQSQEQIIERSDEAIPKSPSEILYINL